MSHSSQGSSPRHPQGEDASGDDGNSWYYELGNDGEEDDDDPDYRDEPDEDDEDEFHGLLPVTSFSLAKTMLT